LVVEMTIRPYRALLLGAAAFVAAGCSGGADSPSPVHGTVYLDGKPAKELAGGTVTFNSEELNKSASGEIEADGSYRLGSLRKDDGAIPGKYLVTVSPPEVSGAGERGGGSPEVKLVSFRGPENSEVTVEQKTNDIPIHLQRRGKAGRRRARRASVCAPRGLAPPPGAVDSDDDRDRLTRCDVVARLRKERRLLRHTEQFGHVDGAGN
jgi:hypothetical protein